MSAVGRVLGVAKRRQGCAVSSTVTGDNTTTLIPVDSFVVDLDEDGGQFKHQPTGDVYDYASCDKDLETLTLTAGLPVGKTLTAGDALYVEPAANDFYADLAIDDVAEDSVSARVPQGLRTILEEGVRQRKKGPLVRAEPGDEEWEITELVGEEPIIQDTAIEQGGTPFLRPDGLPRLRLVKGTASASSGTAGAAVGWDSADIDTEGWWDAAGNTNLISPTYSCHALVICDMIWAINNTGLRGLWFQESSDGGSNWSTVPALQDYADPLANEVAINRFVQMVPLSASKIYRVMRYQNSGAALNFNSARLTITPFGPQ